MIESPTSAVLVHLRQDELLPPGDADRYRLLEALGGDGILVEWGSDPAGLYTLLEAAQRLGRPLLPARWAPARPRANGGLGGAERLLWLARDDGALSSLFTDLHLTGDELDGASRAVEPVALLGVAGDVVRGPEGSGPDGVVQRAKKWIGYLGADRLLLATVPGGGDPLAELGRQWGLPQVHLVPPAAAEGLRPRASHLPLLWTGFQLDREHRLPDEAFIPSLDELLRRGALLRERRRFQTLPAAWRAAVGEELHRIHAWHLAPLMRRMAALVQTLLPVRGVRVHAPLPAVGGISAWLLGLSDRRPARRGRTPDPATSSAALLKALEGWDRRLVAELEPAAWPLLQGRLSTWLDGGLLAACSEVPRAAGRRFCFSGRGLWTRRPLVRDRDGVPHMRLPLADRRALGWIELELLASAPGGPVAAPVRDAARAERVEDVRPLEEWTPGGVEQLELDLDRRRLA